MMVVEFFDEWCSGDEWKISMQRLRHGLGLGRHHHAPPPKSCVFGLVIWHIFLRSSYSLEFNGYRCFRL